MSKLFGTQTYATGHCMIDHLQSSVLGFGMFVPVSRSLRIGLTGNIISLLDWNTSMA